MEKDLPKGWEESILDSIVEKMTNGANLKQSEVQHHSYFPITRIETIANESIDLNRVKYVEVDTKTKEKYRLQTGDILFSHINSDKHLGKTAIFEKDIDIIHGVNLLLIRANDAFDKKLLNYLFKYYRGKGEFLLIAQRAVNQSSINQKKLKQVKIPVPPLAEQKRIVAKLDDLFGHLEILKAKLDRIPELLKNFRQSVLTQAVTGKLTEEWREGKDLADWEVEKIEELSTKVGSGSTPKGGSQAYKSEGIALVRSMNIHFKGIKRKGIAYIDESQADKLKNVIIEKDDVLLNITGASIGRVCVAEDFIVGGRVNQHVSIIRTNEKLNPSFLNVFLASPFIQDFINKENYGVTRQALTKTQLLNLEVKLPPIEEQAEIVKKVNQLFIIADSIESQYKSLKEKINHLPQAILQKAFKGELVPQIPNDEPASVLLERIKGEKDVPNT